MAGPAAGETVTRSDLWMNPMAEHTDDFGKLTGDDSITVRYMFEHADGFQIGARHSDDA